MRPPLSKMHEPSDGPFLDDICRYYSSKIAEFGETPRGVDWNSGDSQVLRFIQLCNVILPGMETFSINDLGCGYGALIEFLIQKWPQLHYTGIDISDEMIRVASARYAARQEARFIKASRPDTISDYGLASGVFNVRLGHSESEWNNYMQHTLDILNSTSRLGFAFNCLTSYSDDDRKQDYLYYADPCMFFDLCKRRYSRNVALFHDYGLFEFTIIVRK